MASGTYGTYGGTSFVPEYGSASPGAQPYGAASGVGPPPDRPPSEHSLLRSGGNQGRFVTSTVSLTELIFVPWGLGALVLVLCLVAGSQGKEGLLIVIAAVLLTLSVLFVNFHHRKGDNAEVILGLLCLLAIGISLCVGATGVFKNLVEYRRLSQGASYFNVLPSSPATGHLDAATMVFTNSTLVDSTKVFGFTDALQATAPTYCVAPISDSGSTTGHIQYWVAGVDCCQAKSGFVCGDAVNLAAHGGIALPKDQQKSLGFRNAVRGAEATYGLTTGNDFLLLEWMADPIGHRDSLWNHTLMLFGIFAAVYLILSIMIGVAILPTLSPAPVNSEKRMN